MYLLKKYFQLICIIINFIIIRISKLSDFIRNTIIIKNYKINKIFVKNFTIFYMKLDLVILE